MRSIEVLGIIPARGGSKSIPRKNIALLNGRPLISYTIRAAQQSRSISRLIVSTDDSEIANISAALGAEIPFMRPKELAQDSTPTIEVVLHALDVLESDHSYCPDVVVLLQPTSPLRNSADIDHAVSIFVSSEADVVVSVSRVEEHPYNMYRIEGGFLQPLIERDIRITLRQNYPEIYRLNGAIYVSKPQTLRRLRSFIAGRLVPYIMPRERSLDIDDPTDMLYASVILRSQGGLNC
ncbi:MAG: acylneuraminate cytidylyltransferase family protein [Candidatus Fermentithermobacillus carboniphilus]|uniref:Acylneuraminate cytidylyltransferase family protein n=1 Tax=Candidatus Fermentithermobacillus carboniphilus TaxID=3085328 RepID=A0AAT9LF82_9FIRM|nr:MAG: acylneuraminate cytidylyltransferase family protein [Candidatus Fermentithermobacillus carboniphilus]